MIIEYMSNRDVMELRNDSSPYVPKATRYTQKSTEGPKISVRNGADKGKKRPYVSLNAGAAKAKSKVAGSSKQVYYSPVDTDFVEPKRSIRNSRNSLAAAQTSEFFTRNFEELGMARRRNLRRARGTSSDGITIDISESEKAKSKVKRSPDEQGE